MSFSLPVLGLGVSLSLSEKPDPLALATDHSLPFTPQFVEYAGLCDVSRIEADVKLLIDAEIPLLFHPSFINFCGTFENSPTWLRTAKHHIDSVQSPWFAQDCSYCFFEQNFGYSSQFGFFIPPILNEVSVLSCVQRIQEVQSIIQRPVAIEPPPVTFSAGSMSMMKFFSQVAELADCSILLDMGHLVSYEMATGISILDEIEDFPVERVVELHIAGGKLRSSNESSFYIDAHDKEVVDETWQMFEALLPELPQVKAVCFECEGTEGDYVTEQLEKIAEKIVHLSSSIDLVLKVKSGLQHQLDVPEVDRSITKAPYSAIEHSEMGIVLQGDILKGLQRQEQFLFELIFDADVRQEFTEDIDSCASLYGLNQNQVNDFKVIRQDALHFEAELRQSMVLSSMTQNMPLTMALLSSFDEGFDLCKLLLKPYMIRLGQYDRVEQFLTQLSFNLDRLSFFSENDNELLSQVITFEMNLIKQAKSLADDLFGIDGAGSENAGNEGAVNEGDNRLKIGSLETIAPHKQVLDPHAPLCWRKYVVISVLPMAYTQLKQLLCEADVQFLWRHLQTNPFAMEQRLALLNQLEQTDVKLVLAMAFPKSISFTDYQIDFKWAEMIDGFAPLLNQFNGVRSLEQVLQRFEHEGASTEVLENVKNGITTLYQQDFLHHLPH